jgi:hypothetical protein
VRQEIAEEANNAALAMNNTLSRTFALHHVHRDPEELGGSSQ